jgi:hypothetical protein
VRRWVPDKRFALSGMTSKLLSSAVIPETAKPLSGTQGHER